jgi:hypothetical protein
LRPGEARSPGPRWHFNSVLRFGIRGIPTLI